MSQKMIALVVVFGVGHVACGQQVVSYITSGADLVIIPSVPVGGLVITDVICNGLPGEVTLIEEDTPDVELASFSFGGSANGAQSYGYHMVSGIPLTAGRTVRVGGGNLTAGTKLTISGYIPGGSGAVPAVGVWGLAIMVLLIVGAGSVVFRRIRVAA